MDESSALESVRAGNTEAFAEIIQLYQLPITHYLYRLTGDWETARDLTQDTFVQAYKSILKTDFNTSFKAWLYKVATNYSYQFFRKNKIKEVKITDVAADQKTLATRSDHDAILKSMAIRETLLKVDEGQRACLLLHFWDGFKYREIAEMVGISEEAVRKRVARGCREFRKHYRLWTE